MKTLLIAMLFGLFALSKIPEPEFTERPYVLNDDNTLSNLERADASIDIKVKGAGYGGSETYYSAFGKASTVRFNTTKLPRMVVKVEPSTDPAELFIISKADVKSDRRRFLLTSRSLGGKVRDTGQTEIALEYRKIRDGLYEITFPNGIPAGEYAFLPLSSDANPFQMGHKVKISCFGID